MSTRVSINGVVQSRETAMVSVFDRGFLFGDSVFEVLRTYGGRLFAVDEHLARLSHSARRIGMSLAVPVTQLRIEMDRALAAATEPDAYVRIMVTRGSGEIGLDPALARDPLRVIIVQALHPLPRALYVDGVALITVVTSARTGDTTNASSAKTSNYLANILALNAARQAGAHEALLVTAEGTVLEGATSNIFVVAGNELQTPALDGAILAGVTRQHVLAAARSIGLEVREQRVAITDLWAADEVFITSSLRELVPVIRIDDHAIRDGKPGPIVRRIHAAFRFGTPARGLPLPWL